MRSSFIAFICVFVLLLGGQDMFAAKKSSPDKKKTYSKILKNGTSKEKLEYADLAYNNKNYKKVIAIYEDMLPLLRGRDGLEDILYRLAYCYYYEGDYFMSSHYFRSVTRQFPNSRYLEEAMYMGAYCKSMESLYFRLDQTATKDAIKQLQLFVNYYPKSARVEEANGIIDRMRAKLARKSFEIANMYYRRELYNAAAIAYSNFLNEFPESLYREEAMYKLVKSRYLYADKSVAAKQPERFAKVIESYEMFYRNYGDSKYIKELNKYNDLSRIRGKS
ncbi:MAG: outer membrane protein assembly factor BamD [Bacteroidales bacterium]|jgi:outer membrane protein assembly factor BamD|nr:outer membrane protein assembly factor BamD [Bacteroidales bacterium]